MSTGIIHFADSAAWAWRKVALMLQVVLNSMSFVFEGNGVFLPAGFMYCCYWSKAKGLTNTNDK